MDPPTQIPAVGPSDESDVWRGQIVRVLLLVVASLSFVTLMFFMGELLRSGNAPVVVYSLLTQALVVCIAISRRMPYSVKATTLLVSMLTGGISSFSVGGDRAAAMANIIAFIALAALLFDIRAGFVALAVAIVLLVVFGVGYRDGWLPAGELVPFEIHEVGSWIGTAVWMSVAASVIIGTMWALDLRIQRSLLARSELVEKLSRESRARANALEELERAQEKLLHAERLETVGRLASGLAHDMNNALTVILAEAEMLPESQSEATVQICDAAQAASQLTRQLLSFGRRDVIQPKTMDLVEVVRRVAAGLTRTLPTDIQLATNLSEAQVPVIADPVQVQHIVYNLVLNARDAMVGCSGGRIEVVVVAEKGCGWLWISDQGSGMDEETLDRIFEPFFTTKEEGRGTGLGLANVRDIVERLEGKIEVSSRPGEGTTFRIAFPLSNTAIRSAEVDAGAAPSGRGRRVLVVDDDIRVRAVACAILANAGFEVEEASDPRAAIRILSDLRQPFALVWTDVVMPQGGGAALLEWMARHQAGTPVLVCSAYADDESTRQGLQVGRYTFLSKPFTRAKALEACAEALADDASREV